MGTPHCCWAVVSSLPWLYGYRKLFGEEDLREELNRSLGWGGEEKGDESKHSLERGAKSKRPCWTGVLGRGLQGEAGS